MTTPQKNTNNGSPENAPESLKGSKRLYVYEPIFWGSMIYDLFSGVHLLQPFLLPNRYY